MHGAQDYLVGLSQLHQLSSMEERRAVWRQGVAALAEAAGHHQPTPLEGLSPESLLASVRVAIATGLVDDLAWMSKAVAASALFELASALPQGQEKRELGRRVLRALNESDAATFVTLSRALALGSRRALAGAPVRARVALSLRLPIATGTSADGLALALISRPELEREWLSGPSTGSLPSRRLAARIVERAAREAARRAEEGDPSGLRVFERPSVKTAWNRLLADRESLVWRHVATARGLLLAAEAQRAEEIQRALSTHLGPTEWRRGAASLAAAIAHDPTHALARCQDLMKSELARRDPGIAVAMVYGLSRAGEEEPQAAEELLGSLVQAGELDVMEALVDLRREHAGGEFGAWSAAQALARLRAAPTPTDDGLQALHQAIAADLSANGAGAASTLSRHLATAVLAFADGHNLRPLTETALAAARTTMTELEQTSDATPEERQRAFLAMRELDHGLLESSTLSELITVSGLDVAGPGAGALPELYGRLSQWILAREDKPLAAGPVPHAALRLRRLRTLLHLLDVEVGAGDEGVAAQSRDRRMRAFRLLLARVEADPPSPLRRTLCAAMARACDALVRDEVCELSEILVAVSSKVRAAADLHVLAEASMAPEVKDMFRAAAEVAKLVVGAPDASAERSFIEAFFALGQTLPPGTSPRVEGMRRALLGMSHALQIIHEVPSLSALKKGQAAVAMERLVDTVQYGAQLCAGARRRLGLTGATNPSAWRALKALDLAIERVVREIDDDRRTVVRTAIEAVRADLPGGIADVVVKVLARLVNLPREASMEFDIEWSVPPTTSARLRLPDWLPASRTLGGFYIMRPIGTGAGGSVFVARRLEDRHDESAETFALKVPSFGGQNAHTLTEDEFLQLFREEAGALLTLPQHPHLAGFVTFDARARPKPILVMELVRGPTLERLLDKRELSVSAAFGILDGVAAGLAAMHASGIGHLDVKPGNIILRQDEVAAGSRLIVLDSIAPAPVLVDFGLAGRKVRPGCASPYYGAPEVWDAAVHRLATEPTATDVYAFSCLAFELFTGRTLFDGQTLPALIGSHLSHSGTPPGLARLRSDRRLAPLAQILATGLARDPRQRISIVQLRDALRGLGPYLQGQSWPVAA